MEIQKGYKMYCKYLSKTLKGNLRCKLSKTITYIDDCKKCLKFEPHVNKPIKKVSNKRITVTKETYNKVMERDKYKCRLLDCTCYGKLELHHIRYRSEAKDLINEPTNCIILCNGHHRLVHSNKHLWQPILKEMINK